MPTAEYPAGFFSYGAGGQTVRAPEYDDAGEIRSPPLPARPVFNSTERAGRRKANGVQGIQVLTVEDADTFSRLLIPGHHT